MRTFPLGSAAHHHDNYRRMVDMGDFMSLTCAGRLAFIRRTSKWQRCALWHLVDAQRTAHYLRSGR